MDRRDLISRGYFPKELPPPFNTNSLANFALNSQFSFPSIDKLTTKLYSHSHARFSSLRRRLSIPNPIFFLEISQVIENYWVEIKALTQKSNFSKSKPIHTPHPQRNRSISPLLSFSDLPIERAKNRRSGRYVLQTDISQFYQSIYTHSIPWAVHGKKLAKQKRNDQSLLGNKLDKLFRNSQDGQTLGIPIGPDTSLIIAELILCVVDEVLEERLKRSCSHSFKGFRYSDDYEFVFVNIADAEKALSEIQQVLSEFELVINPQKTQIIELPVALDASWVLELSNYTFSSKKLKQQQDLIRYFDQAFKLFIELPQDPVLKYAISVISQIDDLDQDNWPLLESLLLQSVTVDPSITRDALAIIQGKQSKQYTIDLKSLEESLNNQILKHAPLAHGSEVAWAIWSIIVFNLSISSDAARLISSLEDSIVALLALDAKRRGRITKGLDTTQWEQFLTKDELYGSQWLLAYEASYQRYLSIKTDYISQDPYFSILKKNKVSFYNESARLIIPPNDSSGPSGQP